MRAAAAVARAGVRSAVVLAVAAVAAAAGTMGATARCSWSAKAMDSLKADGISGWDAVC